MKSNKRTIERIVCPTVSLPDSFSRNKRERGDMGWDRDASVSSRQPSGGSANSKKQRYDEKNEDRAEFMKVMQSIKDINATSFEGMSKKKHKEDKLVKLGAPKVKEQTMPFKMKMGILAGRKKRETRALIAAKESGQVLPSQGKKTKAYKRAEDGGLGLDVHTKRGVLHVSKSLGSKRR